MLISAEAMLLLWFGCVVLCGSRRAAPLHKPEAARPKKLFLTWHIQKFLFPSQPLKKVRGSVGAPEVSNLTRSLIPPPPVSYPLSTGADPGFWSGGSRVLTPGGPEPKICSKLPENCMILKKSWGQGEPAPLDQLVHYWSRCFPSPTTIVPTLTQRSDSEVLGLYSQSVQNSASSVHVVGELYVPNFVTLETISCCPASFSCQIHFTENRVHLRKRHLHVG